MAVSVLRSKISDELMSLGGETFNASLGTLRDRLAGNRIGV
jgi:hypothetical protein